MLTPFRHALWGALMGFLLVGVAACGTAEPTPSPTLVHTPSPTQTAKATATAVLPTAVAVSPTPSPTAPPTQTPTPTPSPTPPPLSYLGTLIDEATAPFERAGGIVSLYVQDVTTGEMLTRDPAIAFAGTSLVKIPILLEAYRVLDGEPNAYHTQLITETTSLSGNYTANLLLGIVSGDNDPYRGSDVVTENLRRLGLYNTFIAAPYDSIPRPGRPTTYVTPANTRLDVNTRPDPNMQTTAEDLGRLLGWIYGCAKGQPTPLDSYAQGVTAEDCTAVLQMMTLNVIESLIEEGVPAGVPIAHKHGWIGDTHGDAAVVFAPQRPYVLVVILHRAGWLEWAESSPLIAEISRLTYAHFTEPNGLYAADFTPAPHLEPTASPTPAGPRAIVVNTAGIGLRLRQAPGGAEITILPEGSVVELLDEEPTETADGLAWRQVRSVLGEVGWVGADYLLLGEP